jgi:hypothetical protein
VTQPAIHVRSTPVNHPYLEQTRDPFLEIRQRSGFSIGEQHLVHLPFPPSDIERLQREGLQFGGMFDKSVGRRRLPRANVQLRRPQLQQTLQTSLQSIGPFTSNLRILSSPPAHTLCTSTSPAIKNPTFLAPFPISLRSTVECSLYTATCPTWKRLTSAWPAADEIKTKP